MSAPPVKVHVAHLMFSYNVGGVERVLSDVLTARRDSAAQYAVVIVNDDMNAGLVARLEASGAKVFRLGRKAGSRSLAPFVAFVRTIRRHKVEVMHIREPDAIPLALLAKLARPSLRLFASVHNTQLIARVSGWKIAAYRRFFERIVVISRAVQAECAARGLTDTIVMNNAVDVPRFAAMPRHRREGPLMLICVARYLLRQKAQDVLIEAVALCVARGLDVRCRLLGNLDGRNEADHRELVALAERLGIADRIEFVVNQTNVEEWLARSDLFVLPSRFEGLGNVVIEAMAAGVPVIASRVDGLCELVTEHENGLLAAPGDAQDLADTIAWAEANPEAMEKLGQAGKRFAEGFDVASYALRYERLYGVPTGGARPGEDGPTEGGSATPRRRPTGAATRP